MIFCTDFWNVSYGYYPSRALLHSCAAGVAIPCYLGECYLGPPLPSFLNSTGGGFSALFSVPPLFFLTLRTNIQFLCCVQSKNQEKPFGFEGRGHVFPHETVLLCFVCRSFSHCFLCLASGSVWCALCRAQNSEIWGISRPCTSFISVTPLHNYLKVLLQFKMWHLNERQVQRVFWSWILFCCSVSEMSPVACWAAFY